MTDTPDSGASTPNNSRFTSQAQSSEDRLKADTVGLVQLSDFRKRRAEAFEAAQDGSRSGTITPDGREPVTKTAFKKRKKGLVKKGGLSFAEDEAEEDENVDTPASRSRTPAQEAPASANDSDFASDASNNVVKKRGLRPNAAVGLQPKALTKSSLLRESQLKDALKREYAQIQDAVKATEFLLPFVFYDGKIVPGGTCRMKKGDFIWLFLDRARKVGADLADKSRRDWARISVDDLILVKGDIIIPHHYDFHHFILNHSIGYNGPLFSYSAEPTNATPAHLLPSSTGETTASPAPDAANESAIEHLQTAAQRKQQAAFKQSAIPADSELEGFGDDPNATKVVDRRWYERNKHIYPASSWEEFDPAKDYTTGVRKDAGGNTMFFSR